MAEYELNIKFVKEVEKYPTLYNYTLPEYSRRDSADKIWRKIGEKFRLSGPECKEKWKNLRSVFVRHLKPPKNGTPTIKRPYYLTNYMQFAVPYIKVLGINNGVKLQAPDPLAAEQPASPQELSDVESEDNTDGNQSDWQSSSPFQHALEPPAKKLKMQDKDARTDQGEIAEYLKIEQSEVDSCDASEQNANRMFLLSVLPDMNKMNDRIRRVFKRKMLELVDELIEQDTDMTNEVHFYSINK